MKMILRGIKRLVSIRPDILIMRAWPVWFFLTNRSARLLHRHHRPELSAVQRRIAEDLARRGISVVHVDELFAGERRFPALEEYTKDLMDGAAVKTKKRFLQYLLDATPTLNLANPFIRLMLDRRILDTVNAYMGMGVKFHSFTLNVTTPVGAGAKPMQSQRWHRDPDDKKMCKVFLYLTDVDESAGPFTYVAGSQYGGKWRKIFPQLPPLETYPPEGAIEKRVPSTDMLTAIGRAGTMIFCDTSGLHRGGYATQKNRVMFTAVYVSSARTSPITYRYPEGFQLSEHPLDAIQRYALEN